MDLPKKSNVEKDWNIEVINLAKDKRDKFGIPKNPKNIKLLQSVSIKDLPPLCFKEFEMRWVNASYKKVVQT